MISLQQLISSVREYFPDADIELIEKAYNFVHFCHQGQTRASGEPYVAHVTEVAFLATKLKLDIFSIVAALLHDTIEDTPIGLEDIRKEYGSDIAELVDGLTKLDKINFGSKVEQQAESFRKMLFAMARDIRVLLLKLCDKTHNMRTLEYLPDSKRLRIAQETLDIYVPLAHRMGINWMKSELEDLSFKYLRPALYESVKAKVNQTQKDRERYTNEVIREIMQVLKENNLEGTVSGRIKTHYSIYKKLEKRDYSFEDLYDIIAFRVIVPTVMNCYATLGVIHAKWRPIPDRFKDYIAMPKPNNYQSLHTAVIGPQGTRIEIQIRTREMHDTAEKGIAAHWTYKETGYSGKVKLVHNAIDFNWLKDLLESEQMLHDPREFMSMIKGTLFHDAEPVYVFSPKGDLIELPAGSTPIDFAFHIHSEVGLHCQAARVNGQHVPISYRLQNGDSVEIITSPSQFPSRDWLRMVASSKARQHVRHVIKTEEFSKTVLVAKELLSKEFRKVRLNFSKILKGGELLKVAEELGYKAVDTLLADVGYTKLSPQQIISKFAVPEPEEEPTHSKLERKQAEMIKNAVDKSSSDGLGIKISGMDRVVFRFARCCEPLPGDEIIGFVTRGRGVAIHKKHCEQLMNFDSHRFIDVSWDENSKTVRSLYIRIVTVNEIGILATLTKCIADNGINMVSAKSSPMPNKKAIHIFKINLENNTQAGDLINAIEKIDGVFLVERGNRFK